MRRAIRLAEWLFEDGIGERRAALICDGAITAIRIERDGDGIRPGTVTAATLLPRSGSERLRKVRLPDGELAILRAVPPGVSDGASLLVHALRAAIPEVDIDKLAIVRPAAEDDAHPRTYRLIDELSASEWPIRQLFPHEPDALEAAGWSEWAEAARSGQFAFPGGLLRMSLTPAMTVFDVDGDGPPLALAMEAAKAFARVLPLIDIGGSIVIDLPTLAAKAERNAVGQAFDGAMPAPFERTAINGFGLMQVIRPRHGPSLAERWQYRPVESAALALLRQAERQAAARPGQPVALAVSADIAGWIERRPALIEQFRQRTGVALGLHIDPALRNAHGHVR